MIVLDMRLFGELRQRLGDLRNSLTQNAWQRADSLLRKAALALKLSNTEWAELCALLGIGDALASHESEVSGDAPAHSAQSTDVDTGISPFEYMRQEQERLFRFTQRACVPKQGPRR